MLIQVTQSHIDRGCMKDAVHCPIAEALAEAFKCYCIAAWDYLTINVGPDEVSFKTPSRVFTAMSHYDETGRMTPFEFELDMEGVG